MTHACQYSKGVGNEENEQGMEPFLLTENKYVSHIAICKEGYTYSILGKRDIILEPYMTVGNNVTSGTYTDLLGNKVNPQ